MIVFPVLIPSQNFLFPGTGREIIKCHGKGNLRLVFPGITGNGNSRSPWAELTLYVPKKLRVVVPSKFG